MEISTMPTDSLPSGDGGRHYQAGSITGGEIEDAEDVLEKNIDSTVMVCQPEGKKFKKGIVKGSPFDGDKPRRIELGLQNLLQRRKTEDGNDASKKHIDSTVTGCQPEGQKFEKGIANGSSSSDVHCLQARLQLTKQPYFTSQARFLSQPLKWFIHLARSTWTSHLFCETGSKTNNTASPVGREDPNLTYKPKVVTHNTKELPPRGYKFASRDLKSVSLLGKGFSGIVYETIWKKKLRCARKDFVRVPSAVFERETKMLIRLEDHSNVVQTFGWAVAKICCSLVLELMDCSLRSLTQRRKLLRRMTTSSEPHIDSTSTLDSGCSNSPEIPLIPQQEIEKKMNGSYSPMSVSCEAQTSSPFSILEVIQIITAIAAGVKHLHDNKVAHGDLKPGNVLVTLKKRAGSSNSFDDSLTFTAVKVADFGVIESKSMSRCMTSVSSETRELEKIRRKAPELFDIDHGLKQDFDTLAMGDVYSFGMTASEILSAEEPYSDYQSSSVNTLRELILKGTRPELPARCQQLNELIRRCWDCKPTKRPNFGSILEELKKIQAALSAEDKLGVAMWPTSHVLESSSTKGLDDRFSQVDHSLIKHSSLDMLEMVN